jgi:hypothetical protein
MTLEERVKFITEDQCGWDWEGSNPSYNTVTPNCRYGSSTKFDPFPCYSHNKELVLKTAELVEKRFRVGFDVFYFIFPYEPVSRTNGQAHKNTTTYADNEKGVKESWEGVIELHGKRIPPHPAMTRYLVAHEYGHIVDYWICRCRGLNHNGFDEEYAKMRGIENNQKYGGRRWHSNIGEVIANDFRIAVCDVESEFWPHDVVHPKESKEVNEFWYKMMLEFSKG